jgi:hypothetical protein
MRKLLSLILLTACAMSAGAATSVKATVDEPVEFVCTVFRLAGIPGYVDNDANSYVKDVDRTFAKIKHPIFSFIRQMGSEHQVGFDAVANYAIMLDINKGKVGFKPNADVNELPKLDERWTVANARRLTTLLNDFYRKSNYHKFFLAHQRYYRDSVLVHFNADVVGKVDWSWFAKFFGNKNVQAPHIVGAALIRGNYGVHYTDRFNGRVVAIPMIGPTGRNNDGSLILGQGTGILVHEYGHTFSNPAVEHYRQQLEPIGKVFGTPVLDKLREQAYTNDISCMYETMNRACNLQYDYEHAANATDSIMAKVDLTRQKCNGFLLIEDAYNALSYYKAHRDIYPTYDSFMPVVVERFSHLSVDSVLNDCNSRRGIMTIEGIADGDSAVAPGEHVVTLHFSEGHKYGFGFTYGRKGNESVFPEITSQKWDNEAGNIVMTFNLKPETSYSFGIPGTFFMNGDGYPMRNDIYLDFKTTK